MALFGVSSLLFFGTHNLNAETVICSLVSAVLFSASSYANLNAMKGCKIVVVSLFSFGGLIVSCLISWIWFGEAMSILQALGLLVFILAMYLLSSRKRQRDEEEKRIDKKTWLLLAVVMLADGLVMVAQKYFSLRVDNGNVAWYSFFTFLFTAVFMACGLLITVWKQRKPKDGEAEKIKRLPKTLLLCGIFLAFALFMINILVTELGKTISSVILFPSSSAISLSITALVGWVIYKEKLSVKNFIG